MHPVPIGTSSEQLLMRDGLPWRVKLGRLARRALERATVARSRLHRDCGAEATVAALAVRVAAMGPKDIPLPAHQLAAWIKAGGPRDPDGIPSLDPELASATLDLVEVLEWCDAGLEQIPDDRDLTEVAANALLQAGDARSARVLLETALERVPDDEPMLLMLSAAALEENDPEAVASMDVRLRPHHPDLAMWLMARWYGSRGQWASCLEETERLLGIAPEGRNARRLAVKAAIQLEDFATAVSHADVLCELTDVPPGDHWLRIEAASAAQSWRSVRAASAALSLPIDPSDDPDAPVEEVWGPVAVDIPDEFTGERDRWAATRTGPATARIIAVAPAGEHQRYGDEVVFFTAPIDQAPEDPDEETSAVLAFPHLSTVRTGGFRSFCVEGVYPGADAWAAFWGSLRETGRDIWIGFSAPIESEEQSGGTGTDARPEPDFYFVAWLATSETSDLTEDFQLLDDLTAQWKVKPSWTQLARSVGRDVDLHRERAKEFRSLAE